MFREHYIMVVLGCFWLSFSVLLTKLYSKKIIFVPTLIILLFAGIVSCTTFIYHENLEKSGDIDFKDCISKINENDAIIAIGPPWIPYYSTSQSFYN
jgi:hypothetical protein